ncbi:uncharacterized protein LOC103570437 [Microplitis demolitor]|uniref:uncharacterized protein LOC103570437 n=1 Tax=Microplitis demolitor TaxID=69319 RepID=UPI0004CD5068|nr:uncharacterized protein LOC103570437 [Microplitis demolitor]XP_008546400.1 uncharacterized protein LOC103570437 [Microplitis demolitor]
MFGLILLMLLRSTLTSTRTINALDSCSININYKYGDFAKPQPLILTRNNSTSFLYPQRKDQLDVFTMDKIILACPGKNNYLKGIDNTTSKSSIELTCIHKKYFFNFSEFNFKNISCNYFPNHVARKTESNCYNNNTHIEIGFLITDVNNNDEFLRTFELCFNDTRHWTYFTHYKLTNKIGNFQSGFPRPRQWTSSNFSSNYNLEKLYKVSTQVASFELLLGSKKLASKFVAVNSTRFLSKGHMVAKGDFVYGNEQRSTFWYLNAAPQWQSFNGGNWNILEKNIRTFASKRGLNLEIYTGVHDQMKIVIEEVDKNEVPVFLFVNETARVLEVPRFYWKIIYQPEIRKGTAFVGLNDPYRKSVTQDMFICRDVSEDMDIKWLKWNKKSLTKGISYVCDVNELRKVVASIPEFPIEGILV